MLKHDAVTVKLDEDEVDNAEHSYLGKSRSQDTCGNKGTAMHVQYIGWFGTSIATAGQK